MSDIRKLINLVESVQDVQEATYSVVSGDNLTKIAKRNGISLGALLNMNPELKANPDLIQIGQKIKIPGKSDMPQPSVSSAKVTPEKGIGITAFAKQLGYDSVDEFIAAQEDGGGKIGTMKSGKYAGNNFVYTNQQYIPKATSSEPATPSIAKSMSKPNVDSAADIAKTVSDMSKAAEYKPEPAIDNKTGMIKIGDIMATQKEIDIAKSMNPNVSGFPSTDADLAKDIKAGRRLQGSSWTKPTASYKN